MITLYCCPLYCSHIFTCFQMIPASNVRVYTKTYLSTPAASQPPLVITAIASVNSLTGATTQYVTRGVRMSVTLREGSGGGTACAFMMYLVNNKTPGGAFNSNAIFSSTSGAAAPLNVAGSSYEVIWRDVITPDNTNGQTFCYNVLVPMRNNFISTRSSTAGTDFLPTNMTSNSLELWVVAHATDPDFVTINVLVYYDPV